MFDYYRNVNPKIFASSIILGSFENRASGLYSPPFFNSLRIRKRLIHFRLTSDAAAAVGIIKHPHHMCLVFCLSSCSKQQQVIISSLWTSLEATTGPLVRHRDRTAILSQRRVIHLAVNRRVFPVISAIVWPSTIHTDYTAYTSLSLKKQEELCQSTGFNPRLIMLFW